MATNGSDFEVLANDNLETGDDSKQPTSSEGGDAIPTTNGDSAANCEGGDGNQASNGDSVANGSGDDIQQAPDGHQGYMYKESDNKQSWDKKYFILKANKIEFFKAKGDARPEGIINLVDGLGVREKDQCKCNWPSDVSEDYCFGLATKSQTWYFKTTPEEGSVGDWKRLIQETIVKVGKPDPNSEKDPEGKPLSFFAKKAASIGAFFTKIAMKFAPVDDRVKDGVTAGADMVKNQADAENGTSLQERAAMAVKDGSGVVGGAVGTDVAKESTKIVGAAAEAVQEVCKEQRKEEEKKKKEEEKKKKENSDED